MSRVRVRVAMVAALALAPWWVMAPASAAVEIPADCAVPPEILELVDNVVIGTDASERLEGTDGADLICGRLGDDVIEAGGGDDVVLGDTSTFFGNVQAPGGADRITGGAGGDQILSGPGDDRVNGGSGDDFLALAVGDDTGQGGPGADIVYGGFGHDLLLGGAGTDELAGGQDDDLLNGGPGDDALSGQLPAGTEPPPGVPVPPAQDRCVGAGGVDSAAECDDLAGVEEVA